jgi:hypothetical protein
VDRLTLFFLVAGSEVSIPAVLAKIAFPAIRDGWITGPVGAAVGCATGVGDGAGASACASEKTTCLRFVDMLLRGRIDARYVED